MGRTGAIVVVLVSVLLTVIFALGAWVWFAGFEMKIVSTDVTVETVEKTEAEMMAEAAARPLPEPDWAAFDIRWAEAPDALRELARTIAARDAIDMTVLEGMGNLSAEVPVPELSREWDGQPVTHRATLLEEAVRAYNLEAVNALLEAGADPCGFHCNAVFMALGMRTHGAPPLAGAFGDYSQSLEMARSILKAGGDPNSREFGFRNSLVENTSGDRNLGGMLVLLEFGANPWQRRAFPPNKSGSVYIADSVLTNLAFGSLSPLSTEVLFRLARSGHLPRGEREDEEALFDQLEQVVEKIADGSGPTARHQAWRMDQVLQVLGQALDLSDRAVSLRSRLPEFDYTADGGWYLAEDQLHSPWDSPLGVPDKGDEIWGP